MELFIRARMRFNEYNCLENTNDVYSVGDKICQMVIMKVPDVEYEEVDELNDTSRGSGGFGSTGR
jgi:dUTP pyrophosphatase